MCLRRDGSRTSDPINSFFLSVGLPLIAYVVERFDHTHDPEPAEPADWIGAISITGTNLKSNRFLSFKRTLHAAQMRRFQRAIRDCILLQQTQRG